MINKQLNEIDLDDMNELINNAVLEGKTLDYKRQFPSNSDSDRKEFLADISSFSNTSGGDLIFGVKEYKGSPTEIIGVEIENIDQEIRKYENIIRDGIEPRIIFSTHVITIKDNQVVFIFRMNKSWIGPHRVIFKGHDKFYGRNSAGKYALDTNELKIAFNLSQTLIDKVEKFKSDRIIQLSSGNTPIPFYEGGKIVLQLIPLEAFEPGHSIDINLVIDKPSKLRPLYCSGWNHRINLEGILTFSVGRDNKSHSYTQLYRNGIIEVVEGLMLRSEKERKLIPSVAYEKELIKSFDEMTSILRELDVSTPVVAFLNFIGIKDYEMAVEIGGDDYNKIDKDILQLPEVIVESFDIEAKEVLRPLFDLIWNACGYKRSYNFDENGDWITR